ncbi:MAG: sigma 54-interacting transcriptional regulator [Clostridiales Family XIII bacterium]|nr:sigma 54-interacting transcriptional regulator [Clostridiales Family XIII bacterium]
MRKQEQLIKSHNFSKAILEEIDEAIVVVDTDGSVIMMNKTASALLGMSRGNADDDSMRIAADCNIDHFLGTSNYFRQVLNEGTPVINKEWLLYVGDATQRCIGTVRPIFAENAAMQGAIGTFRDMRSTKKVLKHFGWNASFTFDNVIGSSPALMAAVELAKQTAHLMNNTLLQGESGTGKEIFAQSIHNESHLKKGPFVAVNCAAIPTSLLESELFGYEKGAYTGAKKNGQAGKFELAEGGTIFLDEINSVPLDMQAKLLRVLQEKTVTRVGGTVSISLNLKIIAACNADLKDMVSKGLFRQDLYYRLNVITINIPPLRERIDDIRLLAENILLRKSSENQSDLGLSDAALEILKGYHWPGNVRELENLLERAYVRAIILKSNKIDPGILSFSPELFPDMPMPNKKSAQSVHLRTEECEAPRLQPLKCHEENTIYKAFASNRWNISRTAKALGISRNTLYRKMKSYQIEIPK